MGDAIVLAKQAVLPHQALGGLPTPPFTHQGTRSQKNGGFFAPGSSQTDSPGGRRLPSELWVGGAALHGCLVLGGNARVQPPAYALHSQGSSSSLRTFKGRLLHNRPGSCENQVPI